MVVGIVLMRKGETMSDLISRQAAIDALNKEIIKRRLLGDVNNGMLDEFDTEDILRKLPSAQPERDIPIKPIETTDKAWGIPHRQAVCPRCDYYLGHVAFLGDYKGKRITYCETCGQAIDWEGWNFNE